MTYKKIIVAIVLTFIIAIAYQVLASYMTSPEGLQYPNPGHYPGQIGPGTFNCSSVDLSNGKCYWSFPNALFINSSSGKLGIGTTVPEEKLHVFSSGIRPLLVESDAFLGTYLGLKNTGDFRLSGIRFYDGNTPFASIYANNIGTTRELRMYVYGADRLIINDQGNVGIGITSPTAKLDVNGSAKIRGDLDMNNKRITNVAAPIASSDAATKGYVDAQVGGGGGGMGLQGNIIFHDISSNYGISTIPLSLPKANCNVKITVCDYSNNPPTKLIIGADPVPRITKPRNDTTPSTSTPLGLQSSGEESINCCTSWSWGKCAGWVTRYCPSGYTLFTLWCEGCGCASQCVYISEPGGQNSDEFRAGCCPANGFVDIEGCLCYNCPDSYPNWDDEDNLCYAEPRCPSAESGEVFIQEDDVDNVCVYCPSDHPIYDATTKHCIREASTDTVKVGDCATLSAVLESAFTDVTFANANNQPLSTADYVAVAYSCPSQ